MPNIITRTSKGLSFKVDAYLYILEDTVYAACPSLNYIASGDNEEEAKQCLLDMLDTYSEYVLERNTLEKDLLRFNWRAVTNSSFRCNRLIRVCKYHRKGNRYIIFHNHISK